ncbi:MAG: hypothetical protein AAGA03_02475 [Planctomycetota bacterium]
MAHEYLEADVDATFSPASFGLLVCYMPGKLASQKDEAAARVTWRCRDYIHAKWPAYHRRHAELPSRVFEAEDRLWRRRDLWRSTMNILDAKMKPLWICLTLISICGTSPCIAYGQDEVSRLKSEIEQLRDRIKELEADLKTVTAQRDDLQREIDKARKSEKLSNGDLFQIGARWSGTRFVRRVKKGQRWNLVISERDGERFSGQIQFVSPDNQAQQLDVSGSAPKDAAGKVVFKTNTLGVMQQAFTGVLKGDQISLTWEGTGVAGKRVVGTANLAR